MIILFENYLKKNFNKWFGESKVVDNNGKPLIVYHGSDNDRFETFKLGYGFGYQEFYFTDTIDHASDYGHNIYKVYLKIENPKELDAEDKYYDDYYDIMTKEIKWAKNDGYDGVIIHNLKDPKEGKPFKDDEDEWVEYDSNTIFVVFESNQIKSTTDNNSNFSVDSDSIF